MTTTTTRTLAFVLAAAATMFVASAANAVNINLNIVNGADQAGLDGPAGGLGETWNQESTTSAAGLLDTGGGATGVGYTSGGTSWGGPDTWDSPTLGLIRDGLRNFDTSTTNAQNLHINGLTPGELYDVWIASANTLSSQRSQGEWTMVNATSSTSVQTVDNTASINGATWELGNNYVVFEDVVVDGAGEIVLTGHARRDNTFDTRLPLNGFQLREVVASVPEPSTFFLASLGLTAFAFRRRRRR
jgi:hypothetical protein